MQSMQVYNMDDGLSPIWEEVLSDEGFNKVRSAVITETFSVPDMMNPLSILAQKVNNKVK